MALIAWTPPNGRMGIGSVVLRMTIPESGLTHLNYPGALWTRIDRLTAREGPEDARRLLRIAEEKRAGAARPGRPDKHGPDSGGDQ